MDELEKKVADFCAQLEAFRLQVEQSSRELTSQVENIIKTLNS